MFVGLMALQCLLFPPPAGSQLRDGLGRDGMNVVGLTWGNQWFCKSVSEPDDIANPEPPGKIEGNNSGF